MRRTDMDSAIRRARDVRLAPAGLPVLSMTANPMLTMSFAGRETVTAPVPATAGPVLDVGGSGVGIDRAGSRYLEHMARTAAVMLPREVLARGPALPARSPHRCRSDRAGALRTDGERNMTNTLRRHAPAALAAAQRLTMGVLAAPAAAMQILDAADHAELAAAISATSVKRIALAGDRVATAVRATDGFAIEHDARSGDLCPRPSAPAAAGDAARGPVALLIGSEKGFPCRLTPTRSHRGSTQIPIRNAKAFGRRAAPDSSGRDSRSGVRRKRPECREPAFSVSG